jgi:hypothetical protein
MSSHVDEEDAPEESFFVAGSKPGTDEVRTASNSGEQTLETGRVETGSTGARYEIGRKLGRGGMADVFFARRMTAGGFGKDVALKCVTEDFEPHEAFRRMFLNEARLASHLHHHGIAEAYDLEEIGGRVYLVLEFIDGVSVRDMIRGAAARDSRIPRDCACYVTACVAEALHHAHTLCGPDDEPFGIVHRDVSGSNVMVTKTGVPKLLDFGIAFARMQGRDRTGTGRVRGTYAYLSPEQAAGRELDWRSDLFSLALLLVEMLTGKRVFDRGDDILTAQAIEECSTARVAEATRQLPASLQKICRRALAKDPAGRFQSGDELAHALRDVLAETASGYGARECAGDLVVLGLVPGNAADVQSRGATGRRRRRGRVRITWLAALVVGAAAGAATIWLVPRVASAPKLPQESRESVAPSPAGTGNSAPAAPAPGAAADAPAKSDIVPSSGTAASTLPPAVSSSTGSEAVQPLPDSSAIVRRRRVTKRDNTQSPAPIPPAVPPPAVRPFEATPAMHPLASPKPDEASPAAPRGTKGSAHVGFADRGTVANAAETLPRGTLVRAKLSGRLDARPGNPIEAVVTEDVLSEGSILVPRGSLVRCRTGGVASERIGLSCDSLRAGARSWAFSALALGDGDRPGLRVEEGSVAPGTEFVVFVTASAVLE